MKTPPPQLPAKGKKLPKAEVQYGFTVRYHKHPGVLGEAQLEVRNYKPGPDDTLDPMFHCAVLPLPRQQAAQLVRFMRMDEDGRVQAVAKNFTTVEHWEKAEWFREEMKQLARAALRACGLITKGAK